jgi:hypothetical protein
LAAAATPFVVYVQCVAGSETVEADAEAEADADGLAFFALAGELPPTNAALRPPASASTQNTTRPMPSRFLIVRRRSS